MVEANENNCCSGCLGCLATVWRFVKMIICCRCRSLARSEPETYVNLVPSEVEDDPGTSPNQTRARFRSVIEACMVPVMIVLPRSTNWRRRSTATQPTVTAERTVEEQQGNDH